MLRLNVINVVNDADGSTRREETDRKKSREDWGEGEEGKSYLHYEMGCQDQCTILSRFSVSMEVNPRIRVAPTAQPRRASSLKAGASRRTAGAPSAPTGSRWPVRRMLDP